MLTFDHKDYMFEIFWHFLAYLRKYIEIIKLIEPSDTDPARTQLISILIENMQPVLHSDVAFVGHREPMDDSNKWVQIVTNSVTPKQSPHWQSPLIKKLATLNWRLPYKGLEMVEVDQPEVFFDEELKKLPAVFAGLVTALAICKISLFGREFFLFFCDIEKKKTDFLRYTNFEKSILTVATGLLEVGFESGVRRGRQAQKDIEEAQTRQFLIDLAHELKTPIQGIVADASNLHEELPADLADLREIAERNLSAAYHLSLLVDNIRLTLSGHELSEESLIMRALEIPLQDAINMFRGEAQAKGIEIRGPDTPDGQPMPRLLIYYNQLTIAFKNLIHNAIIYSLPEAGKYRPVEIFGQRSTRNYYQVDIINYGLEIPQADIEQGKLFNLKYRGQKARQLVASGTGLGLAFVQRVVKRHKGEIKITSLPTESSCFQNTFTITIPTSLLDKRGPQ